MTIRTTLITSSLIAASLVSGAAHAVLQGRDLNGSAASFEAYYDTDLDITWLADANANGEKTWANANDWANNLSIVDTVNNITYDNWRLPIVRPINGTSFNYATSYNGSTDVGYNISEQGTDFAGATGNEMAHLFYNTLNNKGYCDPATSTSSSCSGPQADWGLTNTGPFTGLDGNVYWSATELYAPGTGYVRGFDFSDGSHYAGSQYPDTNWQRGGYAFAVSIGDVAAVPESDTWAMLLAGLGLVGATTRRRRG